MGGARRKTLASWLFCFFFSLAAQWIFFPGIAGDAQQPGRTEPGRTVSLTVPGGGGQGEAGCERAGG